MLLLVFKAAQETLEGLPGTEPQKIPTAPSSKDHTRIGTSSQEVSEPEKAILRE